MSAPALAFIKHFNPYLSDDTPINPKAPQDKKPATAMEMAMAAVTMTGLKIMKNGEEKAEERAGDGGGFYKGESRGLSGGLA
ncbi:hypothetical protein V6N11_049062 [Hibiscus sabdariffa]|uniref:Uncharacterized protein n=1 Tax=Hibiscus sabdariffa TaxID=183260 RepID=A0ABR2PXI5_9ROSI